MENQQKNRINRICSFTSHNQKISSSQHQKRGKEIPRYRKGPHGQTQATVTIYLYVNIPRSSMNIN